jgi:hypothetical protein
MKGREGSDLPLIYTIAIVYVRASSADGVCAGTCGVCTELPTRSTSVVLMNCIDSLPECLQLLGFEPPTMGEDVVGCAQLAVPRVTQIPQGHCCPRDLVGLLSKPTSKHFCETLNAHPVGYGCCTVSSAPAVLVWCECLAPRSVAISVPW